ncbi:MAG: DUF2188 domain-containing protein [Thermoanaerobaculia bacterium]|nr:DUF2188 domain-containing protein [Thermoanaerobaculia bacterium]
MAKKSEDESRTSKKKILATAAGVAAATAAGVVVAKKIKQSNAEDLKVYHVLPVEDGWAVKAQHEGHPHSTHATKKEALEAAREVVKGDGPTQLIIHRKDGSLQDSHRYGEEHA